MDLVRGFIGSWLDYMLVYEVKSAQKYNHGNIIVYVSLSISLFLSVSLLSYFFLPGEFVGDLVWQFFYSLVQDVHTKKLNQKHTTWASSIAYARNNKEDYQLSSQSSWIPSVLYLFYKN